MFKKFATLLAIACATQAQAAPVTIDFNAYGSGTLITNQYAASGVTFGRSAISNYLGWGFDGYALSSSLDGGDTRTGYIDIFFTQSVRNVSFDYGNYGGMDGGFIQAFDRNNTLLETITYGSGAYSSVERLSFSASNIDRILVTSPIVPYWIVGIDNLSFEVAPSDVPEPASIALLGLGAAGLLANRRRKQA